MHPTQTAVPGKKESNSYNDRSTELESILSLNLELSSWDVEDTSLTTS